MYLISINIFIFLEVTTNGKWIKAMIFKFQIWQYLLDLVITRDTESTADFDFVANPPPPHPIPDKWYYKNK